MKKIVSQHHLKFGKSIVHLPENAVVINFEVLKLSNTNVPHIYTIQNYNSALNPQEEPFGFERTVTLKPRCFLVTSDHMVFEESVEYIGSSPSYSKDYMYHCFEIFDFDPEDRSIKHMPITL